MKLRSRVRAGAGRCVVSVIVAAAVGIPLQTARAQTLVGVNTTAAPAVTISPGLGGDDTARIQDAIDRNTGAIRFSPGIYNLNGPLHLRGSRTYIGEGNWDSVHGSVLAQHNAGAPIFSVEGPIYSVNIIGLTFDGAPGVNAKGIAAGNSTALLATSTIRDSYFLTTLNQTS